ncbi:MAG: DUF1800 family protein [Chitinophagales bacterium]|nr:DUF1800 family protein [Chitinophagales bacterium]
MASLSPLTGALGHRRAAHLLRRTSFNFTKTKVDQMASQTASQALASLLQLNPLKLDQPIYKDLQTQGSAIQTWLLPLPGTPQADQPAEDFVLRRWIMDWWCHEAIQDTGMGHKMTFFFHQFFQTTANSARNSNFFDYLQLLRWGAFGNFKKLAYKMVTDNNMLLYLNNTQNNKINPNENFAREFLELFTIGKGPQIAPGDYTNYTEEDIVQAARVLTGFRSRLNRDVIDPETGIPRGDAQVNQHVTENKTFSSKFNTTITGANTYAGMWTELQAFVDMVFAKPETAKNLCRRLYHFFVSRNITTEIENDIIVPLSNTLVSNNFEIKPVLQQLLASQHFYDADDSNNADEIIGGMIKSPLELNYQTMTFFGMPIPDPMVNTAAYFQVFDRGMLQRAFANANLPLFFAADVAGYPAYYQEPDFSHQWFNSSTIIARYKMGEMFLTGILTGTNNQPLGTKLNIANWLKNSGVISDPSDSQVLVEELLMYLLPEEVDTDRFNYFHIQVFLDNLPPSDWTYEWENYLTTNDPTEVTLALERLIKAILYSPEYQTF